VAHHILNDSAKLPIKSGGIISMDSGDKAGASTDIDLFFVAPITPFMALIELYHSSSFQWLVQHLSIHRFASSPVCPLTVAAPGQFG
jgi:hypothetical protein